MTGSVELVPVEPDSVEADPVEPDSVKAGSAKAGSAKAGSAELRPVPRITIPAAPARPQTSQFVHANSGNPPGEIRAVH